MCAQNQTVDSHLAQWSPIQRLPYLWGFLAGAFGQSQDVLAHDSCLARILLCFVLSAGSAAAQNSQQDQTSLSGMSIEDLAKVQVDSVYGASKFLQKASDSPTSVTVVTREEIEKYGYRTLADVLKTVRGFYVIYDRNYTYVGVRGFSQPGDYNARILFLVDGHRINDDIYDGAYVGTEFPVDVDLIERIEIIRGPTSSIYGAGAFAAVINVITRRGRDLGDAELSSEAGSWNSYKGRLTYGARFDSGLETLVSGSFYNSLGHDRLFFPAFNNPATNDGIAEHADGDQSYSFFGDLIYRDFDIHFVDSSRDKHIPTGSFGTVFDDPRTQTTDARRYVDVQYHHTFGSWETLGRVSYDWYQYHGNYIYNYSGTEAPPYTDNYDAAEGDWWDLQLDASRVFFAQHKITMGVEFRQDLEQKQLNFDVQPYHLYTLVNDTSWVAAPYIQDEYSVRHNLTLVFGLRADWHERFRNNFSPRVGLLFAPTSNAAIRVNYSSAFRDPNSFESFYAGNNTNTANPSLMPESIHSGEIDFDYRFERSFHLSAAGFLNRFDDLITPSIDSSTGKPIYLNSAPVQTKGIELELGAKWQNGIEGELSDSVQDSEQLPVRTTLTNSPRHLAKANLSVPIARTKFFVSADAQYVSARTTVAQTVLGGYFIANFNFFTRKLGNHFDISGGLYNALNKQYAESGSLYTVESSIPQDGRSFRIKLTYNPRVEGH